MNTADDLMSVSQRPASIYGAREGTSPKNI